MSPLATRRLHEVVLLLALVATSSNLLEAQKTPTRAPNILWIMLDDCRADAFSCHGKPWARTPNMDRVAGRGVRFTTAIVQNMVCQPSRESMLTGHYCHSIRHMAMGKPENPPPGYYGAEAPLDTRIDFGASLARLGMEANTVGKTHWGEFWLKHPYQRKDPEAGEREVEARVYPLVTIRAPQTFPPRKKRGTWIVGGTNPLTPAESLPGRITDRALEILDGLLGKEKPFFLRVSYHAPHIPITVPAEFMIDPDSVKLPYPSDKELRSKPRFERDLLHQYSSTLNLSREQIQISRGTYYGMVSLVDHHVGRILDRLEKDGQLDNTLIVINSDHGLQLGEHGLHKKRNFYDQTVAVPLIFSWPGHLPTGKVIDEPVELIDFTPTLFDLVDVDVPEGIAGRSLMPLINGEVSEWREAVFCEHDFARSYYAPLRVNTGRRIMVRTKEWKLIYFRDTRSRESDGALYDLRADPEETTNLYKDPRRAGVIRYLEKLVDEWDGGRRA